MNQDQVVTFIETEDTLEETHRLALESIVRWTQRSGAGFNDTEILSAIALVANTALKENYNDR